MRTRKIVYLAGYPTGKHTGRNKATLEKAEALRELLGEQQFRFYCPAASRVRLGQYLLLAFFDVRMLCRAFSFPTNTVVIERQTILLLTNTWLRLRGIAIVAEVHADAAGEMRWLEKPRIEKALLRMLTMAERHTLSISKGIICNHPRLEAVMKERYRKPFISVYNGANTETFVVRDSVDCRKRLGLKEDGRYFLFLGMISRWHGVEQLIDIFRDEAMKGYTLLLVGAFDNQYVDILRARAGNYSNIVFIAPVDIPTSVYWINASDACVVPVSDIRMSPGSPLKLYDYIACGKPVLAQAGVMGYGDEVEKWKLGASIDFNNAVSARAEMIAFIGHADSSFYTMNNRRVAETVLSWKHRMQEWLRFIDSLSG